MAGLCNRLSSAAAAVRQMPLDLRLLFIARFLRMTSYGGITVALLPYLRMIGMTDESVGMLLSAILFGDLLMSFVLTTKADNVFGRKCVLLIGAALKLFAGLAFAVFQSFWPLAIAGALGVITSTGGEIGPFLAVEQASIATVVATAKQEEAKQCAVAAAPAETPSATAQPAVGTAAARASGGTGSSGTMAPPSQAPAQLPSLAVIFGWFNAVAYLSLALGALLSGFLITILQAGVPGLAQPLGPVDAHRAILLLYAVLAWLKMLVYSRLSSGVEVQAVVSAPAAAGISAGPTTGAQATATGVAPRSRMVDRYQRWPDRLIASLGLASRESALVVARLSVLFCVDAFAGGFCMQTFVVQWYSGTWSMAPGQLGSMMSAANVAAGISGIVAARLVERIGAVPTMVYTHLPSNVLLLLIPAASNAPLAVVLLLLRFCLSQMDVPARQAYVTSVVGPAERSAANGITNTVRSLGLVLAPIPLGHLAAAPVGTAAHAAPFLIAGGLKIFYDLSLYGLWRAGGAGQDVSAPTIGSGGTGQVQAKAGGPTGHASTGAAVTIEMTGKGGSAGQKGASAASAGTGNKTAPSSAGAGAASSAHGHGADPAAAVADTADNDEEEEERLGLLAEDEGQWTVDDEPLLVSSASDGDGQHHSGRDGRGVGQVDRHGEDSDHGTEGRGDSGKG